MPDREALARYLAEYAADTATEWMRNIVIDDESTGVLEGTGAYVAWQTEDGEFILGETKYDGSYGRFKLSVSVAALPGNDPVQEPASWIAATWRYVLAGDRVRLGQDEAEVTASNVGERHVDTSDYWHPKPWEHTEVKVKLKHTGEVWLPWPPDDEVEIFMDASRACAYILQKAFEGTQPMEPGGLFGDGMK